MIKIIKNNKLLIISFLILLSLLCYYSSEFIRSRISIDKINNEQIQFCLNNDHKNTEYEIYCDNILANPNLEIDFFTAYTNIVVFGMGQFSFILFLFVIIPSLYNISKYLKNKIILNELTRKNYKNIKKKLFYESYKSALILPIIIIIAFIICYLYCGDFDYSYAIQNSTIVWDEETIKNPYLFIILYLLNILFHCILYINISLCIVRKHNNYFIAIILSFLTYIGIEAILEIGFNGILFTSILKSNIGIIFNIMNMLTFNDRCGMFAVLLVPFVLMIISFIVLHYLYKDKEKLVIECEQNN